MINIKSSKIIGNLLIVNLFLVALLLASKMYFIQRLLLNISKSFLAPLAAALLLFYILRPLNMIFVKKGLKYGIASVLTLSLFIFIFSGILFYFGNYLISQFYSIVNNLSSILERNISLNGTVNKINEYLISNDVYKTLTNMAKNNFQVLGHSLVAAFRYIASSFSKTFLIIVILFYLLKDGHKFKTAALRILPDKYNIVFAEILDKSDEVLSSYVTGQAKVALSLAIMIFAGYKIIGIPNALLLSFTTFILGFIPFVGFFISMIIPVLLAVSIDLFMLGKLLILFIVVQTLKGRVVVPTIMSKAMHIHPLTDIVLVIGAISIGGPLSAFAIVPVYAICKETLNVVKKYK